VGHAHPELRVSAAKCPLSEILLECKWTFGMKMYSAYMLLIRHKMHI